MTYEQVLAYVRQQADQWAHLEPSEALEQVDAHLESEHPDAPHLYVLQALDQIIDERFSQ